MHIVEVGLIVTLLGASSTYLITAGQLLFQTAVGNIPGFDLNVCVLLSTVLVMPLAMVPDLSLLSQTSALGLVAVIGGFIAIFYSGIQKYGSPFAHEDIPLTPRGAGGVGTFFG